MASYTTWSVVINVREGTKHREVKGPGTNNKADAEADLDAVRASMKAGEWVDLPWFSARADVIEAAYLSSSSFGFA
jgi:hypothetical protein